MAVISFDLNGTLLDPGEQSGVLQQAVRLAIAHTMVGDFRPFAEFIQAAGGQVPEEQPAFDDVPAGLERLARAGHELTILTNSSLQIGEQHLRRTGLRDRFTRVASVEDAQAYKPHPRAYELLPSDWHVAAHWWDILGAAAAGRRTVYIARQRPLPATVSADIVVERLDALELPR